MNRMRWDRQERLERALWADGDRALFPDGPMNGATSPQEQRP